LAILFWGLKPSIDFTGGSLLDISFTGSKPTADEVTGVLNNLNFKDASVRSSGEGFIIRTKEISQDQKDSIVQGLSLSGQYSPTEKTFSTIGPVLGYEAIQKAWVSIILVLLAIVLFVAFAFRKVSKPVSSWIYGLVTVLALLHDVLIPAGIFAILGHFYGFEVDTLFVTALLVILGFSVHDTIVVFDRIRENLHSQGDTLGKSSKVSPSENFEIIVGNSISQTFIRSINTSLTVLLAILVLYLFGPETIKNFTLVLLIGIFIGTYSSIFIGSTLLVTINYWKNRGL
jgi:preprotein translocase subunit SecF